jgi:ankyrin repeat protein
VKEIVINSKSTNGETPSTQAAAFGHRGVVKQLLDHKDFDVKATDRHGRTTLWWLAAYAKKTLVQQLLERAGTEVVGAADAFGQTPAFRAAEHGNDAVARLLLDSGGGVDANSADIDGRTPLLVAAKNGHAAVVELLVGQAGINIYAEDRFGGTAYSWVMQENHTAVMLLLDQATPDAGEDCRSPKQPHARQDAPAVANVVVSADTTLRLNRVDHDTTQIRRQGRFG